MKIDTISINVCPGGNIDKAINTAMDIAQKYNTIVTFVFGKIAIAVTKKDTFEDVKAYYNNKYWEING